ncbi:unnamed protein product [Protopolystoma xenopodis]|uniref:Uncharacterized protein n=1 Tax=Protopolystoma xenopodis TaxID=117903 RepID=A0A448WKL7_9PLAT|nr:unnamed protein product [Protopolystoma xenopodis]
MLVQKCIPLWIHDTDLDEIQALREEIGCLRLENLARRHSASIGLHSSASSLSCPTSPCFSGSFSSSHSPVRPNHEPIELEESGTQDIQIIEQEIVNIDENIEEICKDKAFQEIDHSDCQEQPSHVLHDRSSDYHKHSHSCSHHQSNRKSRPQNRRKSNIPTALTTPSMSYERRVRSIADCGANITSMGRSLGGGLSLDHQLSEASSARLLRLEVENHRLAEELTTVRHSAGLAALAVKEAAEAEERLNEVKRDNALLLKKVS